MALLNLVILFGCAYAYRSFVAGILLLIPVNLSNVLLGAVHGRSLGIGLDVNTLPIAAIGIGVGIDYGIYLLSRICEEYQLQPRATSKAIAEAVAHHRQGDLLHRDDRADRILPWYFLSELKFLADMGLLLVDGDADQHGDRADGAAAAGVAVQAEVPSDCRRTCWSARAVRYLSGTARRCQSGFDDWSHFTT